MKNILKDSENLSNIKEKLTKQYNFTKWQLAIVLEKYKDNTTKLKNTISKIEKAHKDACEYTQMNISAFLFDALTLEK